MPSSSPTPAAAAAAKAEKRSAKRQKQLMGQTTGVLDYLHKSLSRSSLIQLYAVPDRGQLVCRAVFQQLAQPTQQVIMRLLCTGGIFPQSSLNVWIPKTSTVDKVLKELYKWAILAVDNGDNANNNNNSLVRMTPEFQNGLQESLAQLDASPWTALTQAQLQALQKEANKQQQNNKGTANPVIVTPEDLERYTQSQWDAVLHFLVGTVGPNIKEPPPAVVHFLLETGLMQPDPDYKGRDIEQAPLVITQKGYEFMLQDTVQQVWHFCVQYLLSLEAHKRKELVQEALLVLISLSFARVGYAYNCGDLSKDSRVMMKDLALFGLLYTRKVGKTTIFYPTRIAMQLVGGKGGDGEGGGSKSSRSARWSLSSKALESSLAHPRPHDSSHLAIILQTNFQLCAYTTSELHVSMLALFCDVQTIRRLPNVVFMTITRDSIKSAFNLGIQARQILRFLEKHAHPRLRTQNLENAAYAGPMPSNVVDQIWLWDRELTRVTFTPVYHHECLLQGEFAAVKAYATDRKALAYCNERRQQLWIDYKQVERIQHFARQWRARQAARQQDMEE